MAKKSRILLLTRDPQLEETFKVALEGDRHHVVEVREMGVLGPLLKRGAELVAVDLELPEELLQESAATLDSGPEVPVLVLISGAPTDGEAERWHQYSRGAPLGEQIRRSTPPERLSQQVERLLAKGSFLQGTELVGSSSSMRQLRERVLLIAPTPIVAVLVIGESGAGKDLVAQALHRFSERSDAPFRPINCAAIPENLLESELFGHEKGAFTDAKTRRQGLFEQADGGTVFLDEIGEMSQTAQIRLLRVLEQREVTRVGGGDPIPVDIRVIAATNKNLQEAVGHREFRLDLYHRLKVVELTIPPLRQRVEDIPQLIDHFVAQFARDARESFQGLSEAAMALLFDYDWPGNVRELSNLVENLVYLGPRRQLEPQDLLPHLERPPVVERHLPVVTNKTPDQSERELIYFALLDLKREVAELRRLVEEHLLRQPTPAPPTPIYRLEEPLREVAPQDEMEPTAVEQIRTLKDLEKEAIEQALHRVGGNRKKVAELLGISPRTLYRKLDEYELR
jgi:DNA-binding NtrC family response regulator